MYPIFEDIKAKNLEYFFADLLTEDVEDICPSAIFKRGVEYFEAELVSGVEYNAGKTQLSAVVRGNSLYEIRIVLKDDVVSANCTCPYDDGECKHIVAILLFCIENPEEIEMATHKIDHTTIQQYLDSLTKQELIELVLKYGPESFFVSVKNKFANSSDAKKVFLKVQSAIQKKFKDDELLHNPSEMEEAVDNKIGLLKGLETQLGTEIKDLIFFIIQEIDKALDGGYLYDDDHYSDYSLECTEKFQSFVADYLQSLPYKQKIDFFTQLDEILSACSYNTYDDLLKVSVKAFTDQELPSLKTVVTGKKSKMSNTLKELIFSKVKDLLSEKEKEVLLLAILDQNTTHVLELADMYQRNNQPEKVIAFLDQWLSSNGNSWEIDDVYSYYLDFLRNNLKKLKEVAKGAITKCASEPILKKIAILLPDDIVDYEQILETIRPEELLNYLESGNRLSESMALINRRKNLDESSVYNFFKHYKKDFPVEAQAFMIKLINHNLEYTGERHYEAIADALKHIRKINPGVATQITQEIRINYKRRRNLIALIAK